MQPRLDAFFQPAAASGQRLYLLHTPAGSQPVRGTVLYVHPWAEEMNKSRRMTALTSRALAAAGWAVLQVDLLGCGDSSGDFGDAGWQDWIADVCTAAQWLQARHPALPLWLWGLRAGALLCTAAAPEITLRTGQAPNFLFWQPVPQGKQALQQFLRLNAAAPLAGGKGGDVMATLRAELKAGRHVFVAGYRLGADLASGLESAELAAPAVDARANARMVWLELAPPPAAGAADPAAPPPLSPAAQTQLARWQQQGWSVSARAVPGARFWQTLEIEDAPELTPATVDALASALAAVPAAERAPALHV